MFGQRKLPMGMATLALLASLVVAFWKGADSWVALWIFASEWWQPMVSIGLFLVFLFLAAVSLYENRCKRWRLRNRMRLDGRRRTEAAHKADIDKLESAHKEEMNKLCTAHEARVRAIQQRVLAVAEVLRDGKVTWLEDGKADGRGRVPDGFSDRWDALREAAGIPVQQTPHPDVDAARDGLA